MIFIIDVLVVDVLAPLPSLWDTTCIPKALRARSDIFQSLFCVAPERLWTTLIRRQYLCFVNQL